MCRPSQIERISLEAKAVTSPFDTRHLPQLQEAFGTQWVPHAGRPKKKRDTLTPKLQAAARLLRNHGYEVREPGE
jgi:hypothetical protein